MKNNGKDSKLQSKFERWFLSHPRISMGVGMICTALVGAGLGFVSPETNQKSKEKIIPVEKQDIERRNEPKEIKKGSGLERILSRHCEIERIINPEGSGNIYLVGSQSNIYLKNSKRQLVLVKDDSVADVQSEIYLLLVDLIEEKGLRLVMGPGIGPKELVGFGYERYKGLVEGLREKMKDRKDSVELFREKKFLQAHVVLELLYKERVRTFGFDDSKEVKIQNELYKKLIERHFEYKGQKNPRERELLDYFTLPLVAKLSEVRKEVSKVRMRDSIRRANVENEKDACVISGAHSAPIMADNYKRMLKEGKVKRRLYLLRPKSISKEDFYALSRNR